MRAGRKTRKSARLIVSLLAISVCAVSSAACGRSYRYNAETEVIVEIDGRSLRRSVVTQCRARDIPAEQESSVIGYMDSVTEIGEPLGVPLPDGRFAIIGGVYGCWSPEGRPRPNAEMDALRYARDSSPSGPGRRGNDLSTTYVFDSADSPLVLDVYPTSRLLNRDGPITVVSAVRRVVDRRLSSDLKSTFPAARTFGAYSEGEGRVVTRFAGLSGKRWTAASAKACASPAGSQERRNCQSDGAEDVVFVRGDAENQFVVMDSPPPRLGQRLYRIGQPAQNHSAPIQWRPTLCVEGVCSQLNGISTMVRTPSGTLYEVHRDILDLNSEDFLVGRSRLAIFRNGNSLIR